MNKITELRKKYYESISLLQNKQDILAALPQPEYENFFQIITGIIEYLNNDLSEASQELQKLSSTDFAMQEYIKEEISLLLFKKKLCTDLLEKGTKDKKNEGDAKKTPKKNIIFATTDSGNVCIENDMKTIPEEYYESVEDLLSTLQEGIVEENTEKAKGFTTVNKKIAGIHEIKNFKVRLFYKNLSADTVYVLMVRMKKSNNDRLDREEIIIRASKRNKQYKILKQEVENIEKKQDLIQVHKKILDRLLGYIKHNKR